MSIEREGRQVTFCCDTCPEVSETGDDFHELLAEAKAEGWRVFKVGDEWCHACPDCASNPLT